MTTIESSSDIKTSMSNSAFWKAIEILLKKPHVVNKRIWGCKVLFRTKCKLQSPNWHLPSDYRLLEKPESIENYRLRALKELKLGEVHETDGSVDVEVVLEELFPKVYTESHAFQLIVLNKQETEVTFYNVTPNGTEQNLCPCFTYTLQLQHSNVILKSKCTTSKSYKWLKETVLPHFIKWGKENSTNEKKYSDSLALVCSELYYEKYNNLKYKYGKEMVKIWPECTDPAKFVYEDIAIATYLLLLWEEERKLKCLVTLQTFVDLGCGNGLLVYILTKEGHPGVGIDVRKRQIWNMYSSDINLKEVTIRPSDSHLFPETDWIIGNHSDELTPWIPVIAARSSYKCNFFLLPCCAFNFDGTKYCRQNSSQSQYTEYLHHIRKLCEDCGFKTDIDRLKIPSTKRVCLVGRGRTYSEEKHDEYCNKIKTILNSENTAPRENTEDSANSWVKDFKPRESKEKVRNCTQIDKKHINSIVKRISNYLLEGCSLESEWSLGKAVELLEVVQLIPHDELKALKSECGGLQTLLKNNHQIFKVQGGRVQFRYPKSVKDVNDSIKQRSNKTNTIRIQQKPCWFYNNHPQGCPLKDSECSFLHVKGTYIHASRVGR